MKFPSFELTESMPRLKDKFTYYDYLQQLKYEYLRNQYYCEHCKKAVELKIQTKAEFIREIKNEIAKDYEEVSQVFMKEHDDELQDHLRKKKQRKDHYNNSKDPPDY